MVRTWFMGALGMLGGIVLSACGELQPMSADGQMIDHQVRAGDTLYSIAWRYGYDHQEVASWNNIEPPFIIHPGDHIYLIPPGWEIRNELPRDRVTGSAPKATEEQADKVAAGTVDAPRPSGSTAVSSLRNKVQSTYQKLKGGTVGWAWPTNGEVLSSYAPRKGKKGLDIGGRLGQSIRAAAKGRVVYSGSGLIGYGKLIIIKHNDSYLSAYGHNRKLLVEEGKVVNQGEVIAEMGDSGKEGVRLHFEIRRNGKPVDPLRYLPRRGS